MRFEEEWKIEDLKKCFEYFPLSRIPTLKKVKLHYDNIIIKTIIPKEYYFHIQFLLSFGKKMFINSAFEIFHIFKNKRKITNFHLLPPFLIFVVLA